MTTPEAVNAEPRSAARRGRITKRLVDATAPEAARFTLWDVDLKGFGLRVTPQGVKTFVVRYRTGGGRTGTLRQHVVGRYGVLTPDQAREEARQLLAGATKGDDPQAARAKRRAELTVAQLCDVYLEEGCTTKKALTVYTDRGRIERHIKPLLGDKRVSAVAREDVERFMRDVAAGRTAVVEKSEKKRGKAVVKGGPGAATRALGLLGAIFEFSINRQMRSDNPARGVRRFKDKRLERFLSAAEMARLGDALAGAEAAGVNAQAITIIRLLALSGARRNEIAHLKWSEVDIERSCLRLADSKTGAKVIPLGAAALTVLADRKKPAGGVYVFPSIRDPLKAFDGTPKAWGSVRVLADLPDVRLHDLRHSFASTGLASGQTLPLIGKLLGHADIGTTQRYAHLADDPVKLAADRISRSIEGAMSGKDAVVHSMRASR